MIKMKVTIPEISRIAESFYAVADKLDKVWRTCQVWHHFGNSSLLVGGLMALSGITTYWTTGAAIPLLSFLLAAAGVVLAAAEGVTKVGAILHEEVKHSEDFLRAEELSFMIRAVIENKGSEAAIILREKAGELDRLASRYEPLTHS